MAKIHKAHKSSKKYGFQKKHISVKTLLIILAVIVVAGIGLKIAYDDYVYGEFEVTAPANEQLNNIAQNWQVLDTHTDKFLNYYSLMGYSADGTDGNGGVVLLYTGNDKVDEVSLQINAAGLPALDDEVTASGAFGRTTLTDFINGVAPWGQTAMQLLAGNDVCTISVYDADVEKIDDALLNEIIAEIEAIIAEGPVVVEEAAEETTEAAE